MQEQTKEPVIVKNWYESKYLRNLCLLVLSLLAIYLVDILLPLVSTILKFVVWVLFPFFLSLILYYFVRPIVNFLKQYMHLYFAIAIVYVMLLAFFAFLVMFIYPHIMDQIENLKKIDFDAVIRNTYNSLGFLRRFGFDLTNTQDIKAYMTGFLGNVNSLVVTNVFGFISSLSETLFAISVIPLILFYLLKDDKSIYHESCKYFPKDHSKALKDFLHDVDTTLMHFINARVIVSGIITIALFIAFLVIGLEYSYILAITSFIFFIVPTVGWVLALILPLLVGFSMSTTMGIEVLIIMLVASAVESILITPEVMGKTLTIHPLTVILILIIAGYLYGIVGLLFATPAYALLKVIAKHLQKNLRLFQ